MTPSRSCASERAPASTLWTTAARRGEGVSMRPGLTILSADLTTRIVDEAMRVLGRGRDGDPRAEMRRRLLEHGLPLDHSGQRVLFPRRRRGGGHRLAPRRRSCCTTATAPARRPRRATASTSSPGRPASRSSTTGPARPASRTRPTSSSTSASPTASPTSRTWRRRSRRTHDIEAQVSDAWRLYMTLTNSKQAGRVGRLHRARRRRGWSR